MIIDESNAHEYVNGQIMNINSQSVTELKYVDSYVTRLYCRDNKLTILPELPNVTVLHCPANEFTTLPKLPKVTDLKCGANKLTILPELPNVTVLHCSNNNLTTLPELPNVTVLYCDNNNFNVFEIFSNKNRTLNELEVIAESIESKPFTTAVNMLKQGKRFSQVRLWLQDALIDSGEWK